MNLEKYPRVLVFSNNCFSKTDSNGRTMAKFFEGFPKENIAQFYIQNAVPDFDVCENYYSVTDKQALRSYFNHKSVSGIKKKSDFNNGELYGVNSPRKKAKRTPFSLLVREKVWNKRKWMDADFKRWIDDFSPNIVLLQAGDSAFIIRLATDISKERNIPLVIFNTENYYFKNRNYMRGSGIFGIFYPKFIKNLRKDFERAIEYAKISIYNTDGLKKLYDDKFSRPSIVLYTSSNVKANENSTKEGMVISYLGNLGVGRAESLVELATALQSINPKYVLDIYGRIPNQKVKESFEKCKGISYKGFVNYEKTIEIMQNSTLIVHTENFSSFYKEDLKYAFSTKIADSLASGTCLLYYGPSELESTKYLKDTNSAFVIDEKAKLNDSLLKIITDEKMREDYIKNAIKLAQKNHNTEINKDKFLKVLMSIK